MKVLMLCNAGMSTGMMKIKIEKAAQADGVDLEIAAKSYQLLNDFKNDYDLFLLGPQVRFMKDEVQKVVGDKPVLVISTQDFGMMRGDMVWKQIQEKMDKK